MDENNNIQNNNTTFDTDRPIVSYRDKNSEQEAITLDEWILQHYTEDEMREVFINMDRALKYIHEHGYCIEEFHPSQIEILNNDEDYVRFKKIMKIPSNEADKQRIIQEDIYNSSLIQIGLYTKCLPYLTPTSLKENFEDLLQFVPAEDGPYYRGVVQRGASIYFCEYAYEKRNRDLVELEKQLGDQVGDTAKALQKEKVDLANHSVNDIIYKNISDKKEYAYVSLIAIPVMIASLLMIYGLITWFVHMFT